MLDWKTLSMRPDWSVVRLRSFWNCASRHQGKPNDCARASAVTASKKTMASHPAQRRKPIRKPLKKRLLTGLRRGWARRLAKDNLLRQHETGEGSYGSVRLLKSSL